MNRVLNPSNLWKPKKLLHAFHFHLSPIWVLVEFKVRITLSIYQAFNFSTKQYSKPRSRETEQHSNHESNILTQKKLGHFNK